MRHLSWLLMTLLLLSGCQVEQKSVLGANADRDQGFSGYGVERARHWEGPLTVMMVPKQAPKGITDPAKHLLQEGAYTTGKRNLSMRHEGIRHKGARILNNRPGVIRDKYVLSDKPYLQRKATVQYQEHQATTSLTKQIESRVEALEKIDDAHVMTDGEQIVIGVESSEQDRRKLIQSIEREIEGMVNLSSVHITTNRRILNRMKAFEHHVDLPRPLEPIGGAVGELVDLIDDAPHEGK